jgi:hypothetical protein
VVAGRQASNCNVAFAKSVKLPSFARLSIGCTSLPLERQNAFSCWNNLPVSLPPDDLLHAPVFDAISVSWPICTGPEAAQPDKTVIFKRAAVVRVLRIRIRLNPVVLTLSELSRPASIRSPPPASSRNCRAGNEDQSVNYKSYDDQKRKQNQYYLQLGSLLGLKHARQIRSRG